LSDTEPKRPRKNSLRLRADERRKLLRIRLIVGLIAALMIVGAAIRSTFQPVGDGLPSAVVTVERGKGVGGIGETLAQSGVIRSPLAFQTYVRWHGAGSRLRAGRYTLSGSMSLARIVQILEQGPSRGGVGGDRLRVTVPEGFTLAQIAAALEANGICDAAAFRDLVSRPGGAAGLDVGFPLPSDTLEGYLFPDTYDFLPHTAPQEVAKEMLLNFSRRFVRPKEQDISASGHTLHEVVTLASLIEREARVAKDRPRIAGVLENRLKKGMKLEIDATVLYALGHHKDRVYYKDLAIDSPYNTYRHTGLPPGPIASPGMASLEAALHPEAHDYLYYVAQKNGEHLFSRTRAEHEAAIRKVRAERAPQTGGTR
jgi:UPF0755 protein